MFFEKKENVDILYFKLVRLPQVILVFFFCDFEATCVEDQNPSGLIAVDSDHLCAGWGD